MLRKSLFILITALKYKISDDGRASKPKRSRDALSKNSGYDYPPFVK